jgi:hypothetical protein
MKPIETPAQPVLFSDVDLSRHLGVSVACLRKWRIRGMGPRWIKLGALVRYRLVDVDTYLDSCPAGGAEKSAA